MTTDNEYFQKKNTILIRALIASGAINIIVLGLLSYWMIRERPPSPYCELKPQKKEAVSTLINALSWSDQVTKIHALTFNELIDLLNSDHIIGKKYREKDIALACLIDSHFFDIQRALMPQNLPVNKHVIKWKKNSQSLHLNVYPNLKKNDFYKIIQFARTERWPLTTEGLFLNLQAQIKKQKLEATLLETLAMTSEFWAMELLLNRSDASLSKLEIATLLAEGNWNIFIQFVEQQRKNHDLSIERRRQVLLEYATLNSTLAAELLIKLDKDYVLQKMDDEQIISLLKLLSRKSLQNELFVKELLISPRSEDVWQNAANLLYTYAGEKKPAIWNYQNSVSRFICSPISKNFQPFSTVKPLSTSTLVSNQAILFDKSHSLKAIQEQQTRLYSVQKGDTLWKISRKFNVKLDSIRKINHLKSDTIKPGIVLKIPVYTISNK